MKATILGVFLFMFTAILPAYVSGEEDTSPPVAVQPTVVAEPADLTIRQRLGAAFSKKVDAVKGAIKDKVKPIGDAIKNVTNVIKVP